MGDSEVAQTGGGGSVKPADNNGSELGTCGEMCGVPTGGEDQENLAEGAVGANVEEGRQYDRLVSAPENPMEEDEPHPTGFAPVGAPTGGDPTTAPHRPGGAKEDAGNRGEGESARILSPVLITRPSSSKGNKGPLVCQVQGCNRDLSQEKRYYKRYRVCMDHLKMQAICVDGKLQRFCQQCGRFHDLSHFDGDKRNCRERLNQHNRRRRKSKRAAMGGTAGSDGSWDEAGSLSPLTGRIVKVPRGRRSRRQIQRRYPGNLWVCDDANAESTEEADGGKDIAMADARHARAYRPVGEHYERDGPQSSDHTQARFRTPTVPGFQRSPVQVGGPGSAFKQLPKGENGQSLMSSLSRPPAVVEADMHGKGSAGIDYQVVLDQIVPTEGEFHVKSELGTAAACRGVDVPDTVKHAETNVHNGTSGSEALQRSEADAGSGGQAQAGVLTSRGQSPVAAVPVILIPAASAAQIVQGLQLGGAGTVALIPTNDNNSLELGSSEMTLTSQSLQIPTPSSTPPATGAFSSVAHNLPVVVPSSSSALLPSVPYLQKARSDAAVSHSEPMVRTMPQASYAVSLALQPSLQKPQATTTQALAAALQSSPLGASRVNELKRLILSGGQAGQFGAVPQVMVTPQARQAALPSSTLRPVSVPAAVSGALSQALEVTTTPRIVQTAVNIPQRTIVLDKSTNQYKLMALPMFPGETGGVHVNHTK